MDFRMKCPSCEGALKTIDTASDGLYVYRTKRCKSCGKKISTKEGIMDFYIGRTKINNIRCEKIKARNAIAAWEGSK